MLIGGPAAINLTAHVGSLPRTDDLPTRLPGSPHQTLLSSALDEGGFALSGTIVVGVDRSEASKTALSWAARYAEVTGATLVAVNSWGPIDVVGVDPEEKVRKALIKVLEQVLGTDRATAVRLVLSPDAPGHLLVHEAVEADLLVVGNRGRRHGGAPNPCVAQIRERVLRPPCQCPVPVIPLAESA